MTLKHTVASIARELCLEMVGSAFEARAELWDRSQPTLLLSRRLVCLSVALKATALSWKMSAPCEGGLMFSSL